MLPEIRGLCKIASPIIPILEALKRYDPVDDYLVAGRGDIGDAVNCIGYGDRPVDSAHHIDMVPRSPTRRFSKVAMSRRRGYDTPHKFAKMVFVCAAKSIGLNTSEYSLSEWSTVVGGGGAPADRKKKKKCKK